MRGRQCRSDAIEIGVGDAAALARAAVVARRTAVVILGENGHAADGHDALALEGRKEPLARSALNTGHLHGRQEFAVRQLRQALACARHTDEAFDVRIPGGDVPVADRPVVAVTILRVCLEVQVAPAINLAAPRDGAPPDLTAAKPAERRAFGVRVRILEIVDEEFVAELVAGVAVALHGPFPSQRPVIAPAAERNLVGLHMLDKILGRVDGPARLEHERLEPCLGQLLRRPATRNAGADHDGIEVVLRPFQVVAAFMSCSSVRSARWRRIDPARSQT
jgi:hypothetical protein